MCYLKNILKIIDFFVSQNDLFRHVVYNSNNRESVKLKNRNYENSEF